MQSKLDQVTGSTAAILSELRQFQALSEMNAAAARLIFTLGQGPVLNSIDESSLEDILKQLLSDNSTWLIRPSTDAPGPMATAAPGPIAAAAPSPMAEVKQVVLDWSSNWSARDINAYLAAYASDFTPTDGRSLDTWRELRRMRLSQSGNIKVTITDLVVDMTDTRNARATFIQSYQSDRYSDLVKKSLFLRLENNHWLITREQSNEVK
jgi:hypothetical protein